MEYVVLFVVVFVLIFLVALLQEIRIRSLKEDIGEVFRGAYALFKAHPEIHKEFFGEYPEID